MITGKEIVGTQGESGDDVGRRHTAHGTKRNLIQTAQSLQTSLRCIDPIYNGFYAGSTLLSPFLTRRMKSKFVVTPPANVTETLLSKNPILCSKKEIPVQYGGNERDDDTKFSNEADSPTKLFLKLSLSLGHLNKVKPKPLKMILNLQKYLSN
ncbi:LOW QUALITY PROTEIN: hypothetical protein HID58_066357 [Brassica napus]|uniref:Uncharacterized protein n=1 Tax=Brassica napus TaxID=3708 RepID=A0ABQ7ZFV4_BRANA|nr:LOW QUALITY PROTEIN: hypothetical protein HID58_066357 [Brassica napus]